LNEIGEAGLNAPPLLESDRVILIALENVDPLGRLDIVQFDEAVPTNPENAGETV
jgi:hypothetical protein